MDDLTPLAPRARWLFHAQAALRLVLVWTPIAVGVGLGALFLVAPWMAGTLAAVFWFLALLRAIWVPSLAFDRWGYALRPEQLVVTHGVLIKRLVAIPTHRIQHVDTHQGPLEQAMRLARLHVYTASGQGADGVIPGLDVEVARELRDELVRRRGDDGV